MHLGYLAKIVMKDWNALARAVGQENTQIAQQPYMFYNICADILRLLIVVKKGVLYSCRERVLLKRVELQSS